jgi:hypothetical protein
LGDRSVIADNRIGLQGLEGRPTSPGVSYLLNAPPAAQPRNVLSPLTVADRRLSEGGTQAAAAPPRQLGDAPMPATAAAATPALTAADIRAQRRLLSERTQAAAAPHKLGGAQCCCRQARGARVALGVLLAVDSVLELGLLWLKHDLNWTRLCAQEWGGCGHASASPALAEGEAPSGAWAYRVGDLSIRVLVRVVAVVPIAACLPPSQWASGACAVCVLCLLYLAAKAALWYEGAWSGIVVTQFIVNALGSGATALGLAWLRHQLGAGVGPSSGVEGQDKATVGRRGAALGEGRPWTVKARKTRLY